MIRRLSFAKFSIMMTAFCAVFFITMFSFFESDQEMYYYFMNKDKGNGGQNIEEEAHSDDGSSGEGGYYIESYGLNLDLIDQLPDCYQKELLSILRKAEKGELNSASSHVSVETLCGVGLIETETYSGTKTLKSYIPFENGEIKWKMPYKGLTADQMTLSNFDKSCFAKTGDVNGLEPYGPFQDKSVSGDKYLYSDIIKHEEKTFYIDFILGSPSASAPRLGFKDTSGMTTAIASSLYIAAHNRGPSGAINSALGAYFYGDRIDYEAAGSLPDDTKVKIFGALGQLTESKFKDSNHDDVYSKHVSSSSGRAFSDALVLLSDNWYFTEAGANGALKSSLRDTTKEIYSTIAGDISDKEFEELVKAKTSNLKDVMKKVNGYDISGEDMEKVYNASTDGSYSVYGPSGAYSQGDGAIFCVEDYTADVYKNKYSDGKTPYVVHCYDRVCAGISVGSVIMGKYVYANMLKEGGLSSVDPANPETYMKVNKIWIGGPQETDSSADKLVASKDIPKWLLDLDLDLSGLTYDRLRLLEYAYSKVGGKYKLSGAKGNWKDGVDCSRFVDLVYEDNNFDVSHNTTTNMVDGILGKETHCGFKWIPTSEALPADPVYCRGHAMLFVGWKNSSKTRDNTRDAIFIHASNPKDGIKMASSVGYFNMSSTKPKSVNKPIEMTDREYIFIRALKGWTTTGQAQVGTTANGAAPAFGTVMKTKSSNPAKGYIAVQAGHYYKVGSKQPIAGDIKPEVGATSISGIPEHTFTFKTSVAVANNLVAAGYDVYLVRDTDTGDYPYGNKSRTEEASKQGCNAHVIIHWDSTDSSSVAGCTYLRVTKGNAPNLSSDMINSSNSLGKCIQNAYSKEVGIKVRSPVTSNLTAYKYTTIPIMLFECGFSSNSKDEKIMMNGAGSTVAKGISDGIMKWLP